MTGPGVGKRADIQALRALAVALVVVSHLGLTVFRGGYVGVDVFFVISGFLITGHLLREISETDRLRFAAFYARRARRILPPALLVAAVTLLASLALLPPLSWPSVGGLAAAVVLFVPNMALAATGTEYLQNTAPSPFQHFWSLGVEEQFYLVWPLMLLILFFLVKRSPTRMLVAVLVLSAASFCGSVVLLGISQPWAFFSLPSRAWEFGIGAVLALVVHTGWDRHLWRRASCLAPVGVWFGIGVIVTSAAVFTEQTRFPGVAALAPVLGTGLVILAGSRLSEATRTQSFFARAPFSFVGRISYSLYLWHWPLLVIPQAAVGLGMPLSLPIRLGLVGVAILLAFVTQQWLERPLARLAPGRRRRVVLASIAGVIIVAVSASVLPGSLLDRTPLAVARTASAGSVVSPPVFTAFVPANLTPALAAATSSTSEAHRNGCHIGDKRGVTMNTCAFGDVRSSTRVVLFGDSHAAHWLPALSAWAGSSGIRVESHTKVGCASVPVSMSDHGRDYAACTRWRADIIEQLKEEPPAAVILANTNRLEFVSDGRGRAEQWASGIDDLLKSLPVQTEVLALANTPELSDEAPVCLSNHLDDSDRCATPRGEALDASWIRSEREAFESNGATYADLSDYFCTRDLCGPIIGNTLVYRDVSHLTEAWSSKMSGVLGSKVASVLRAIR